MKTDVDSTEYTAVQDKLKKTMKHIFYFHERYLKTMKDNISSMILGLIVHLIPKHNHFTWYNQNKLLYYMGLKCSNKIYKEFFKIKNFHALMPPDLFMKNRLGYTAVT